MPEQSEPPIIVRTLPPYTSVENALMDNPDVTAADLLVYLAIARHCNAKRTAWPGRKKIAEVSRLSLKSVDRALSHLRDLGWMQKVKRQRPDGSHQSNVYVLGAAVTAGSDRGGVASHRRHPGVTQTPLEQDPIELEKEEGPSKQKPLEAMIAAYHDRWNIPPPVGYWKVGEVEALLHEHGPLLPAAFRYYLKSSGKRAVAEHHPWHFFSGTQLSQWLSLGTARAGELCPECGAHRQQHGTPHLSTCPRSPTAKSAPTAEGVGGVDELTKWREDHHDNPAARRPWPSRAVTTGTNKAPGRSYKTAAEELQQEMEKLNRQEALKELADHRKLKEADVAQEKAAPSEILQGRVASGVT